MSRYSVVSLILVFSTALLLQCHKGVTQDDINKIEFNYTAVDQAGLKHEGVNVDYEFCIPAKDAYAKKVLHIEPRAKVLQKSKGRSGCSDSEWLCIISNHDGDWKQKLFAIASLPFVERIKETFYE
jgi:hypothetical protein